MSGTRRPIVKALHRTAELREGSRAPWFETVQLVLVGIFVLMSVSRYINPLSHSFLVTNRTACLWVCQTYFFLDACLVLVYELTGDTSKKSRRGRDAVIAAWCLFGIDMALIFLTSVRFLRALKPVLVLRRIGAATEHATRSGHSVKNRWLLGYGLALKRVLSRWKFAITLSYSFALIVLSTAALILESESHLSIPNGIKSYADAVWYCIGQITLTGSQFGVYSFAGRAYSVLLLFLGLGIVGLFSKSLEPFVKNALSSKYEKDHEDHD